MPAPSWRGADDVLVRALVTDSAFSVLALLQVLTLATHNISFVGKDQGVGPVGVCVDETIGADFRWSDGTNVAPGWAEKLPLARSRPGRGRRCRSQIGNPAYNVRISLVASGSPT